MKASTSPAMPARRPTRGSTSQPGAARAADARGDRFGELAPRIAIIANLCGSAFRDRPFGDGADRNLQGEAGNEIPCAGTGTDTLLGGLGGDGLRRSPGDKTFRLDGVDRSPRTGQARILDVRPGL